MAHVILLSVDCGPESEKLRSGSYLACLPSFLDEDDKAPISVGEMHNDIELARSHALAVLLFEEDHVSGPILRATSRPRLGGSISHIFRHLKLNLCHTSPRQPPKPKASNHCGAGVLNVFTKLFTKKLQNFKGCPI
ncbi:unnamed protein product [Clavelina lepadiformis]|uniref:Uncharacterized protein n=1 Tax=Clavelina lepadiformis TaxID=159417 RepID=A0ABP0GD48_CLALP